VIAPPAATAEADDEIATDVDAFATEYVDAAKVEAAKLPSPEYDPVIE
jgi:hypothetical protein